MGLWWNTDDAYEEGREDGRDGSLGKDVVHDIAEELQDFFSLGLPDEYREAYNAGYEEVRTERESPEE